MIDNKIRNIIMSEKCPDFAVLKMIDHPHPELAKVIESSVGSSTNEKIQQVLESYSKKNRYLVGAFCCCDLIGVTGFEIINSKKIIIRHISVLEQFRRKKIGKQMIEYIIASYPNDIIQAETDDSSVEFYKSIGFACSSFQGQYNVRYSCIYTK